MADYMRRNPMSRADLGTKAFEQSVLKASANIMSGNGILADVVAIRTNSIMFVEQVLRQPIPTNMLSKDRWYHGLNGKSYAQRIAIRATQLSKEINQAINSMYAQGKGYQWASKRIAERLGVSNSHAKTLVQTECRVAEVQANTKHYADMGVEYFGRKTVNDKSVCPICKEHKDDVYTTQELKANPWIAILHPHDRCIIEPLSRQRGAERYANRSNK
jgi:SPP1 gp7 family putative phage head morphogenesis protein